MRKSKTFSKQKGCEVIHPSGDRAHLPHGPFCFLKEGENEAMLDVQDYKR